MRSRALSPNAPFARAKSGGGRTLSRVLPPASLAPEMNSLPIAGSMGTSVFTTSAWSMAASRECGKVASAGSLTWMVPRSHDGFAPPMR